MLNHNPLPTQFYEAYKKVDQAFGPIQMATVLNPDFKHNVFKLLNQEPPQIKQRVLDEFQNLGPIKSLIEEQPRLTEILIQKTGEIFFLAGQGWEKHWDRFFSEKSFEIFVQKIEECVLRTPDYNIPFADGVWNDFRVHISRPPLCPQGPEVSLRKKSSVDLSVDDFDINPDQKDKIQKLVTSHKNIMIFGPTGSGKTSFLKSLFEFLQPLERCVILEDTPEIHAPNKVSTQLYTRPKTLKHLQSFSYQDLIKESLRMKPDRLILGELRGMEAKDYLLALSTGHEGALSTLHASDPKEALYRLEMLVQMGAPQWPLTSIRRLLHLSLDGLLQVKFCETKGQPVFKNYHKVCGLGPEGLFLETGF